MAEVAAHEHCLHEIQRSAYRDASFVGGGHTTITRRCCRCGEYKNERLVFRPDPDHGPFGPLVLVPEKNATVGG